MQDIEQMVERLRAKALEDDADTLARQVGDGRITRDEAREEIALIYVGFLKDCWRRAPIDKAAGLEELGIRVPRLVLDLR